MRVYVNDIYGVKIHTIDWEIEQPKAGLLVVHGYAEHSYRYAHVADFFNEKGFTVRSFDFYGHGKSEGISGYVSDFNTYVSELEKSAADFVKDFPDLPLFILAHSMGGVVTGIAAAKNKLSGIRHLVFTNPGLDIVSNQPSILVWLVRNLSKVAPKIQTTKLSNEYISRDPEIRKQYDEDPLNYRGGARPGFANEFDKAGKWLRENAHLITQNVLLNYSLSDKVVNPKASEAFFEQLSSSDKTINHYEGLYHELLNEPEKDEVMENILKWCEARIQ